MLIPKFPLLKNGLIQAFSLPCRKLSSGDFANDLFPPLFTSNPDGGIVVFQTCGSKNHMKLILNE